jgi:hypothetical protein
MGKLNQKRYENAGNKQQKDYQVQKQASCGPTKGLEDAPVDQILQVRQRSYCYKGISSPALGLAKYLWAKPVKELHDFRS